MKKEKTKNMVIFSLVLALIISATAGLAWLFLSNGTEQHTSVDINISSSYIDCISAQPKDAFFSSNLSGNVTQKIKVTINDEGIDKLAYTYTGEFTNAEIARAESSQMQFDYNTYMGQSDLYDGRALSPAFSPIENKVVVNLFIDKKYFDKHTAKLTFLTPDEYSEIAKIQDNDKLIKKFREIYESKAFTCNIKQ